jgi:hypothetical protein
MGGSTEYSEYSSTRVLAICSSKLTFGYVLLARVLVLAVQSIVHCFKFVQSAVEAIALKF